MQMQGKLGKLLKKIFGQYFAKFIKKIGPTY